MTDQLHVLLVDDDDMALAGITEMLRRAGIACTGVRTVADALEALAVEPLPDVVLSDLRMPDVDGFALCRTVRGTPRLSHLPFVFVTGFGDRDARLRSLEEGADDLLNKPVDDVELVARVRSLARFSRARLAAEATRQVHEVLDRVGGGVIRVDLDGRVVQVNPPARRLLGLGLTDIEDGELLSQAEHLFTVLTGDLVATAPPASRLALLHRPSAPRGDELYLEVREEPLTDGHGHPTGRLLLLTDVTDLQRSRRTAEVIVHSINHKFRTPLAGIRGAWELLAGIDLPDDAARLMGVMGRSVDRLERVLLRVMAYASQVAEPATEERRTLRGDMDLSDLRDLLPPDVDEDGVRLELTLPAPLSVPSSLLSVAMAELLDNATSARRQAPVSCTVTAGDDELTVHIDDDGEGIPADERDRVLEGFYQRDRSGRAEGLGLGLGLATTVARRAGGNLTVAESPLGGTRVTLTLPITDPPAAGTVGHAP